MTRIAALSAALSMACACGSPLPSAPSASSPATRLALTCSTPTILAGDLVVCWASDASVNVNTQAVWTSSDSKIATSLGIGLFIGKSGGEATLTATHSGRSASALLTVHLQDMLSAAASAARGRFKVGNTVTLWLQGGYGVASADFGTLLLLITDQTGATVSTSAPLTVPHGGDSYIISSTFTLPPGTTRVCRTGVLQIGSTALTAVPADSLVPCFAVMP